MHLPAYNACMRLFADQTHRRCVFTLIALLICSSATLAQDKKKTKPVPDTPPNKPGAITHMDYGPAIAYTIKSATDKNNIAFKGLAVGLGEKKNGEYQAAMIYDLDTMRVLAGSVGGHLDISKINYSSYKGNDIASVAGTQLFGTKPGPGWANPTTGKWDDPRAYKNGPLPKEWVDYHGHYLAPAREVPVLSYDVGPYEIDEFGVVSSNHIFMRSMAICSKGKVGSAETLRVLLCEFDLSDAIIADKSDKHVLIQSKGNTTIVRANFDNGSLNIRGGRIEYQFNTAKVPTNCDDRLTGTFYIRSGPRIDSEKLMAMLDTEIVLRMPDARSLNPTDDVKITTSWTRDTEWPTDIWIKESKPTETTGTLGRPTDKTAYVLDTIPVPLKNPHNSWMRLTGFDFFADGKRAAVCTWNGDVWIVSGIDDDLKKVTWHRYASGLFEPLGIAIVNDEVYALGRDRLTKLHDKNKDDVADFYENFNSDFPTYPRAITTELQVDSKYNFYFQKNGNRTPSSVPMHGSILRVNKDGSKADIAVHGIRSANGMGIGFLGQTEVIASSDQEGNWTPASRIDFLRHGQYVGYKPHAHTKGDPPDGAYKRPVCWLPKDVDNSPGGLAYIADDRWGPYKGNWIATSYGQCKLFLLMHQTEQWTQPKDYDPRNASETITQGGVVTFPLNFGTGIHRARFNKRDGQLYVLGLKGWQTKGAIDGGFYRVRYTGKPALLPATVEAIDKGVRLTFATPLDRELAEDLESFEVKRWNYQYTKKYGSPEFSVADPEKKGRDNVTVRKAELAKDGKTVTLHIDDMKPVMQMMIKYDLETTNGDVMRNAVYHTVHVLGGK